MKNFNYKILFVYFFSFLLLNFLSVVDIFVAKKIVNAVGSFTKVCDIELKGKVELFTIASNTNKAVVVFNQSNNKKRLVFVSSSPPCMSWSDYDKLEGPKISKSGNSYGFVGKKDNRITVFFFSTSSSKVISTSSAMVKSFYLTDSGNDFIAVLTKRNKNKDLYVYNKTKTLGPFKKVSRPILEKDGDSYAFYADDKLFINGELVSLSAVEIQTIDRIIFNPYNREYVVTGIKKDGKSFLLKSSLPIPLIFDNLSRVDNIYFAPNNFAFTYLSSTPFKREMYVNINGDLKGPYDKIEKFVFSESYTTSAYGFIATQKTDDNRTRYFVNINNKELPVNGFVYDLRLSKDSEKYAFIFNSDNKTLISFGRISDFINASPTNIQIPAVSAGTITAIPIAVLQESDIPNVYGPFDILFNYNFDPDYLIYAINNRYYVAFLNENRIFGYYNVVINYPNYLVGFKNEDQYLITPYNEYGPYRNIENVLTFNPTTTGAYAYSALDEDFKTYVNIVVTSSATNSEISFGPYDSVRFLELNGNYLGFIGSNSAEKESIVGLGKIDGDIHEDKFYAVSKKIFFSEDGSAYAFLAKATSGSPVLMYVNFTDKPLSSSFIKTFTDVKTIDDIEILKLNKSSTKIKINLFYKRIKQLIDYEFNFSGIGIVEISGEPRKNENIISFVSNKDNIYFIAKKEGGSYEIYHIENR